MYHSDRKPLPTVSLVKENILVLHTGYKMAYIKFWSTFDKELCTVSNKISCGVYIYVHRIFPGLIIILVKKIHTFHLA